MKIGINALGQVSQDSGGRTYLTNFVRTCVELRAPHDFFIFYSGPSEDLWGDLPPNFHKIVVPGTGKSSWRKALGEQLLLPFWIIGKKLDAMYFPGNYVTVLMFKPRVVAIRNALHYHLPREVPPLSRLYRKILSRITVKLARRIIVPSASMARDVVKLMGARREKVTVVPHGVDARRFVERAPDAEIAKRLEALGVRRPYFLFVSALWPYKGARQFLEAIRQFCARTGRRDVRAVIAGMGMHAEAHYQELQLYVRRHGLEDIVRFVGHLGHDDLACLYWGAEALVFLSYCESFGNPLLEAMAAGTPVIASNRHAVPETMGEAALIVDPDDTEAVVDAMVQLTTDAELRARLIERDHQRVQQFTWPRAVQTALSVLESTQKPRILLFGYRPPPIFGPSVAYQSLLQSEFSRRFDVAFINISVVEHIRELETVRVGKLLKLAWFVFQELFQLTRKRYDFCCCPIAFNRNAFIKDFILTSVARAFGVPTVLYAHGTGLRAFREKLSPRLQKMFDFMAKNATAAIVSAEALRADFEGLLPADRIFVVELGIEPQKTSPISSPKRDGFTILYLSALSKSKGVFDLLEAMPHVLAKKPDARLVMAGEWFRDEDEIKAQTWIHTNKLEGAIQFVGPVYADTKNALLHSVDVLVFPAHAQTEAFGIVLLEAMEAGLPIVATRGGARSEIIADGVNGLLFEEKNARELAEKILILADDAALRERMGRANREKFENFYTHEHYGERMSRVFEQLAARRSHA
jgi:glycosyltransferase involved in cell wall biosynthesis